MTTLKILAALSPLLGGLALLLAGHIGLPLPLLGLVSLLALWLLWPEH